MYISSSILETWVSVITLVIVHTIFSCLRGASERRRVTRHSGYTTQGSGYGRRRIGVTVTNALFPVLNMCFALPNRGLGSAQARMYRLVAKLEKELNVKMEVIA